MCPPDQDSDVRAAREQLAHAEGDYQRLRAAYLQIMKNESDHEVALAMVGADMNRAHARLQTLTGLPRLPFTRDASAVMQREAARMQGENA